MRNIAILLFFLIATPTLAHVGDHAAFSMKALLGHLLELDHIAFAVIGAGAAWLAFKAGRRAEARAQQRRELRNNQERNRDPR